MKLVGLYNCCNTSMGISIDLDKCEFKGTYHVSYPHGIGHKFSGEFITEIETISIYRTYGKLLGTECEYITYHTFTDHHEPIAYIANSKELAKVGIEFLG